MTETEAMPRQYDIDELLAHSVQPFDDLTARELAALGEDIDPDRPLTVPVVINGDTPPRIINGSQRLQVLKSKGRKVISARDVIVEPRANGEAAALEWAVLLNMKGRQYPAGKKAQYARRMQQQYGWSQPLIAEKFGVSQATISRWLKRAGGAAQTTTGQDGKEYTQQPKAPAEDGPAAEYPGSLAEAVKALQDELAGQLTVLRKATLAARVERKGFSPHDWTVTVPPGYASSIAQAAEVLKDHAGDMVSLARRIESQLPKKQ